jgi:hypothetical protein
MKTNIKNKMETLGRVGDFGTTPGLPANPLAIALMAQAKTVANQMRELGTDQASGHGVFRGGSADRKRAAESLRELVRGLAKVARSLDADAFPGIAQEIRAPRSSGYQALLAAARSILQRVPPIKAAFVDHGVPADFDETMNNLIEALKEATQRKSSGLAEQTGGTAGLADAARRGVALMRKLDAIMTHLLRNMPSLMASWKTASRIQRNPEPSSANESSAAGESASPSPAPAAHQAAIPGHAFGALSSSRAEAIPPVSMVAMASESAPRRATVTHCTQLLPQPSQGRPRDRNAGQNDSGARGIREPARFQCLGGDRR